MNDLISSAWLLDVVENIIEWDTERDRNRIIHQIRELTPSAKSERKKGKWIPLFDGRFTGGAYWFHCSKCERVVPDVRNGGWNFCPECGADMREEIDAV